MIVIEAREAREEWQSFEDACKEIMTLIDKSISRCCGEENITKLEMENYVFDEKNRYIFQLAFLCDCENLKWLHNRYKKILEEIEADKKEIETISDSTKKIEKLEKINLNLVDLDKSVMPDSVRIKLLGLVGKYKENTDAWILVELAQMLAKKDEIEEYVMELAKSISEPEVKQSSRKKSQTTETDKKE